VQPLQVRDPEPNTLIIKGHLAAPFFISIGYT